MTTDNSNSPRLADAQPEAHEVAPFNGCALPNDYATVFGHPGFRSFDRVHAGHIGRCPDDFAGTPCWRWSVGIVFRCGSTEWFDGKTSAEALLKAADAIREEARRAA